MIVRKIYNGTVATGGGQADVDIAKNEKVDSIVIRHSGTNPDYEIGISVAGASLGWIGHENNSDYSHTHTGDINSRYYHVSCHADRVSILNDHGSLTLDYIIMCSQDLGNAVGTL